MNREPTPILLTASEAEFQTTVIATAQLLGWKVVHFRPARVGHKIITPVQGDSGSPDLLMARDGRVLLVELKRHRANLTPAQRSWLTNIGECGRLWTPAQWNDGTIWRELNGRSK